MGWGETISTELNSRGSEKLAARPGEQGAIAIGGQSSRPSRDSSLGLIKKAAVVLDMGEGSREQGFRMNGCR